LLFSNSLKVPIALAAEAQHPVEMVLCTAFGMTFWPFLLGTHAQVLVIGTVIGTISSMADHSGFWMWGGGIQPMFHDWHHGELQEVRE
jgi:sterol desaturase/sphingolipid hydroxylase (fatty acid hydroxylase superfamily)